MRHAFEDERTKEKMHVPQWKGTDRERGGGGRQICQQVLPEQDGNFFF